MVAKATTKAVVKSATAPTKMCRFVRKRVRLPPGEPPSTSAYELKALEVHADAIAYRFIT